MKDITYAETMKETIAVTKGKYDDGSNDSGNGEGWEKLSNSRYIF